ncbi:hypothetical protein [Clostridium sp. CTA-6]
MSKLKSKEIDYILDTYKKLKSIEKTAKETGFSKITVNKYVRDISSTDKRSRYCKNKISQIDVNTNEIIKEWNKPSIAAKELNINPAEICRVLKGELKQAGGYSWKYR